jgi:hypothetical protein
VGVRHDADFAPGSKRLLRQALYLRNGALFSRVGEQLGGGVLSG